MEITSPRVVISPVMAMLGITGFYTAIETRAAKREIPAEGPSLGIAPIGTCK